MERIEITKGIKQMKNFGQIKGHPELSYDFSDRLVIDNKSGDSIKIDAKVKLMEVYTQGKWKTIAELLKTTKKED